LNTLAALGFDLYDPRMELEYGLLDGLKEFREHLGGWLTVMLIWDIGQGIEVHDMDPDLVGRSVEILKERSEAVPREAAWPRAKVAWQWRDRAGATH